MNKGSRRLVTLAHVAMLIALEVVLSRFLSIPAPTWKISFAFVPLAVCAMLYGPLWAGAAGAVADFIGAMLFPTGAFFPGFTLSALLKGALFGFFFHRSGMEWWRITLAVVLDGLLVMLCLSTFWLTIITGRSFWEIAATRIWQVLVMVPVQILIVRAVKRPVQLYSERVLAQL